MRAIQGCSTPVSIVVHHLMVVGLFVELKVHLYIRNAVLVEVESCTEDTQKQNANYLILWTLVKIGGKLLSKANKLHLVPKYLLCYGEFI